MQEGSIFRKQILYITGVFLLRPINNRNYVFKAVEQQIKNFGQTPTQLLTETHPARQYRQVFCLKFLSSIFAMTLRRPVNIFYTLLLIRNLTYLKLGFLVLSRHAVVPFLRFVINAFIIIPWRKSKTREFYCQFSSFQKLDGYDYSKCKYRKQICVQETREMMIIMIKFLLKLIYPFSYLMLLFPFEQFSRFKIFENYICMSCNYKFSSTYKNYKLHVHLCEVCVGTRGLKYV